MDAGEKSTAFHQAKALQFLQSTTFLSEQNAIACIPKSLRSVVIARTVKQGSSSLTPSSTNSMQHAAATASTQSPIRMDGRKPQGDSVPDWTTRVGVQPTMKTAVMKTAEIAAKKLPIPAACIQVGFIRFPRCLRSGSGQASIARSVIKRKRNASHHTAQKERPPLPDGRDGLARSFVHIANQDPVNLYRRSVNLETTTVN